MSLSRPRLGEGAKPGAYREEKEAKCRGVSSRKNKEGNRKGAGAERGQTIDARRTNLAWGGRSRRADSQDAGPREGDAGDGGAGAAGKGGRPGGAEAVMTGRGREGSWTACRGGWARG